MASDRAPLPPAPPVRILTVCLGNICRSPTAEAALREAADAAGVEVVLDSAGTGAWHVGDPPDARMTAAAAEAGLVLTGRARQVTVDDFDDFDLLLAMDRQNRADLQALAPTPAHAAKVRLYREFSGEPDTDVPDPYYGGTQGFRDVVDIARAAARGVVTAVASGRPVAE